MPRSSAARMARIDSASSVPPHIQPPIAQVPSPMREVTTPVAMISMVSNGCPPDSAVAICAELSSVGCGGADGAPGELDRIKLLGAHVPNRAIDLDPHGLVEVMANSLDLTGLERKDSHVGPSIPKCLHGLRQLGFLEAVGSKNRHTEVSE